MMTPRNSNIGFRLDINGLRAYAVLMVLFFHFKVPGFNAGFLGVDIFFVISGFLMTAIICSSLEKNSFKLFDFYMARIRRIFPALMILIIILLVLGWFWLPLPDYMFLGTQSSSALSFNSNLYYWRTSNYFDGTAHEKWLLHTWTLGIEFQFYLLLPIYLLLLTKIKSERRTLLYGLCFAFLVSLLLSIAISHSKPVASFYLLPVRGWEFVSGGLVYLAAKEFPQLQRFAKVYFVVGGFLLVLAMLVIHKGLVWPSAWAALPVLGTVLVILSQQEDSMLTTHPVAQWLGDRSYSIYLWHWPVVVGLYFGSVQDDLNWILFGLVLSLILGHLSYLLVEIPSRQFLTKFRLSRQAIVIFGFGLLASLSAIAISAKLLPFEEIRLPKIVEIAAAETWDIDPRREECNASHDKIGSPSCVYGKEKILAILMGDSHASAIASSLGTAASHFNSGVISWFMDSCPTLDGIRYIDHKEYSADSCDLLNQWANEELKKYPNIPLVLVSRTSEYVKGVNEPDQSERSKLAPVYFSKKYLYNEDRQFIKEFSQVLVDTACRLAKDRPVYLMRPIPEFGIDIPKTISHKLVIHGAVEDMKLSLSEYHKRHKIVWDAQDEAAQRCGVKILNPLPYLCDTEYCYGSKNARPLYYDDDHLSEYGNKFLVPMFEQVFRY